ncbi:hypothetical protein [Pontimicrobium sp. SW4]|uniref:Amidohydrolase-related domain-containing protein n=1 Tax=Pontimicrobium sp. SW4 TaxID=3153519 RepID=A0AAU7BPK2_9FLAO
MSNINKDKKLINAHTHVFTGNFVPPYLAKTIVPWPFFYLLHTGWIINQFKKYYKEKYKNQFGNSTDEDEKDILWKAIYKEKHKNRKNVNRRFFISSRPYLNIPYKIIVFWLTVIAVLFLIEFLTHFFPLAEKTSEKIASFKDTLHSYYLYFDFSKIIKAIWVAAVLWFFKPSRKTVFLVLKSLFPIVKKLSSKKLKHLLDRYFLLGRFTFYGTQRKIAQRVLHQLPPDSGIVILPMDMEYMGAGKSKMTKEILKTKEANILNKEIEEGNPYDNKWTEYDYQDIYKYQMREIWQFAKKPKDKKLKKSYYPFVFIDPRRVEEEGKGFFDYEIVGNRMKLKDCFIKTYMENRNFSGFKIYPALGYYPFDPYLLPIWRYASENNIPIMTHCVMGTIYYRGSKKKSWNYHPVFQQEYSKDVYEPMLLPQVKNVDFQFNFTHPLNYLCLVEEQFLATIIRDSNPKHDLKKLFGYSETDGTLAYNLSNLKICLAHFGGEEEWAKYMESDRHTYSQRLIREPKEAINFMKNSSKEFSWYKLNTLWDETDWYSLICSLLINYENMYADISYIISKPSIYPLLKTSLEKGENYHKEHLKYLAEPLDNKKAKHLTGKNKLRSRILFGTDFYVVRNHNSDKDLYTQITSYLSQEDFNLIARENTHNYLSRN